LGQNLPVDFESGDEAGWIDREVRGRPLFAGAQLIVATFIVESLEV
jgi:hypothetical protein